MPKLTRCDCGLTTGAKDGVCEGCDSFLPTPIEPWVYDKRRRHKRTIDHDARVRLVEDDEEN